MAVSGIVLGLAYIFFNKNPANPLNSIYCAMTVLVVCTDAHFHKIPHLTSLTELKLLDLELESVPGNSKQPFLGKSALSIPRRACSGRRWRSVDDGGRG